MANLLILDASSHICSVALVRPEGVVGLAEQQPRKHAQRLLPMVDELLQQLQFNKDQLDGIAYARGPGSFTGIRIAASVMQGIAMALDIPVAGISTLQGLAQKSMAEDGQSCVSVIDAHMGEVFWAHYERRQGLAHLLGEEHVCTPEQFLQDAPKVMAVGNGLSLQALAALGGDAEATLTAEDLAPLVLDAWENSLFGDIDQHPPVYLRDGVAWKKLSEQPSLLKR